MILRDLIRRSGRSIKSAKGRTLLTALAIAVGTFALTLTLAASNGATQYVNKIISENFDPAELIVSNDEAIFGRGDNSKPREYDPSFTTILSNGGANTQLKRVTDDDIAKIKKVSGVDRIREDITVSLQYVTREGQKKYVGNVAAYNPFQKIEVKAGEATRRPEGKQIYLPEGYLEVLGFKSAEEAIGKTITLAISKTRNFFERLGIDTSLSAYNIPADDIKKIISQLQSHKMTALGEKREINLDVCHQVLTQCL